MKGKTINLLTETVGKHFGYLAICNYFLNICTQEILHLCIHLTNVYGTPTHYMPDTKADRQQKLKCINSLPLRLQSWMAG